MNNLNSLSNNNSSNGGKKGTLFPKGKFTNLAGIIIGVVALIIILIVLHKMRQAYAANKLPGKTEKVLQKYIFDCMNNQKILDNGLMHSPVIGNQYNLTFWFYINDLGFNYQGDKNIMVKGDIIKHLEDTSKPPSTVNPRIYIPASSNSLMFEFEVDNFLDEKEGCYPLQPGFFAEAPAEVDMDCYQIHSDKDYYALTAPLQDAEDSTIRGLCTGLSSSQLDGIDKTASVNDCNPNLEKLLEKDIANIIPQNENFPGQDIFELTNYRMFTFIKIYQVKLLNFLNIVKGTDTTTLTDRSVEVKEEFKKIKDTATKIVEFYSELLVEAKKLYKVEPTITEDTYENKTETAGDEGKITNLKNKLGILRDNISTDNINAVKTLINDINTICTLAEPIAFKLRPLLTKINLIDIETKSKAVGLTHEGQYRALYNWDEIFTKDYMTGIPNLLSHFTTLKHNLRGLLGTLQSFENDMMQHNPNYGNANHMYVKRTSMPAEEKAEIKNVPIQRWNHVSINVHNNITDIFFNGQLELSTEHKGSIKPNTFPLILGAIDSKGESGFNGYVSDLVYTNYVLSEADILGAGTVYSKGPSIMKSAGVSIKSIFSKK